MIFTKSIEVGRSHCLHMILNIAHSQTFDESWAIDSSY